MTKVLMDPHKTVTQKDIALRFLVHFVGDMHQPLHLTGRMRGGNDGRRRSKQLESALVGAIFDPYVRFIVTEGIWGWWRNASTHEWLECPAAGDPYPHNPPSRWATALDWVKASLPAPVAAVAEWASVEPSVEGFDEQTHRLAQLAFSGDTVDFPACPYTWGKKIHPINCEYAWPANWDPRNPVVELDTPEYLGKLGDDKVVEMLLAKGGIRLAAILNAIFLEDKGARAWRE
ncbi:hypothetical protein QFC20_005099 [Naganishia adeliensis]|uniref:Uncharacterized protein n=1 Tax=Naganishia adeliensis TaxID=92952 RepID=A0ACC2VT69_9TREE|nr:hypothetical protein QFC20_005099 [Naganishia adeliensis]